VRLKSPEDEMLDSDSLRHGMQMLETQGNLLFMIKEYNPETGYAKRWTHDGRDEWMHITTGEITDDATEAEGDSST